MYRFGLALLLVSMFWAVWANAQEAATNIAPPALATTTAATNALEQTLPDPDEHALTFGLDRVELLRETRSEERRVGKECA